jgi:ATP-binding cassette subfamily B protein
MIQLLHHLWNHINLRRRYQFVLLLVLMIFTSFAEVLSIGAVIPFLTVITDPNIAFSNPIARPIIEVLHLTEPNQLLIPLTIAFGTAAIIAGGMRLLFHTQLEQT